MSSLNKTPNYNLSQFGDNENDKPSWRGDYTADMSKIDTAIYNATTTSQNAQTAATNAQNTANLVKNLMDHMNVTDEDSAADLINQIETNHNDTLSNENALKALGAETVDKATSLKATIDGIPDTYPTIATLQAQYLNKTDAGRTYATQSSLSTANNNITQLTNRVANVEKTIQAIETRRLAVAFGTKVANAAWGNDVHVVRTGNAIELYGVAYNQDGDWQKGWVICHIADNLKPQKDTFGFAWTHNTEGICSIKVDAATGDISVSDILVGTISRDLVLDGISWSLV